MATYAIGDIQGCYDSLQLLLDLVGFDPDRDRVWLAGDLVNRGPKSLEVLRWARSLGDRAVAVLGNHDTHMLLRVAGIAGKKKHETLDAVLRAPDRVELIDWLRHQPLLHVENGFAMTHAGLHPSWSIAEATALNDKICAVLRADDWCFRVSRLLCDSSRNWSPELPELEQLEAATRVFTKIRTCLPNGDMCCGYTGPRDDTADRCMPWFDAPDARWLDHRVIFGHWAALGFSISDQHISLDSGCVWGGNLSAVRLEDSAMFQVAAVESRSGKQRRGCAVSKRRSHPESRFIPHAEPVRVAV